MGKKNYQGAFKQLASANTAPVQLPRGPLYETVDVMNIFQLWMWVSEQVLNRSG